MATDATASRVPASGTRSPARGPLATLAATAAALGALATVSPEQPGHYPTCPFLALTGWWCPGCGSLRALHALTHGDIVTALDRNVLTVAAVPGLVVAWTAWLRRSVTGRPRSPRAAPAWALWALLGCVLAFAVLRNLPAGAWLAPT